MKAKTTVAATLAATALAAVAMLATPSSTFAADHGDAPALAQDLGCDVNDVFIFLDPTDITQTVIIGTVHGFLVPGEVPNFAVFDENVRYRFEIYNDHVNTVPSPVLNPAATASQKAAFSKALKPNRFIDVTFKKRNVGVAQQTGTGGGFIPQNLRRPLRQEATITLTGFTGLNSNVLKTDINGDALLVTPFNTSTTAAAFDVRNIKVSPGVTVQFFAGEVDDPFFFDIPAFTSFIDGIRNGGAPNVNAFNRQRDTFAGYNTLAIALRIPTALLVSDKGPFLGVDFLAQRHITQLLTNDGVKGGGGFKTVDRMGNPTVNVALIPFDKKNAYNSGTPKQDAQLKFAPTITETLNELGVVSNPPEPAFLALANIAIAYGDILRLNTTISNFGSPAGAGYDHKDANGFALPNGRRLQDDTVDIILTTINHNGTLGDGVANSGTGLQAVGTSFPFLGKPHQPLGTGSGTDDATRN
jgi:hypothetical protein